MSEMFERVARAAEKYLHNRADLGAPINYDDLARIVMMEMRVPTEEMIKAGGGFPRPDPDECWRDMMDAAIK